MFGPFQSRPGADKWAELHGLEVYRVSPPGSDRVFQMINIPIQCEALSGEGLCTLYGTEDRPQVCGDWPQSPLDLIATPSCGYRFERVSERVKEAVSG